MKQHFRWTQIVKTRNVEKYTKYACGYSDDHNVGFPKKNIMVMVWVGLAEQGIVLGTQVEGIFVDTFVKLSKGIF